MAFFDGEIFNRALSIYNAARGNAPEEPIHDPNAVQSMVAQMNALRSENNREWDRHERQMKELRESRKRQKEGVGKLVEVTSVLAHYAADRNAIHQVLLEMEKSWERGSILSIACVSAAENRKKTFANTIATAWQMDGLLEPLFSNFNDTPQGVACLMEGLPVSRHFSPPSLLPKTVSEKTDPESLQLAKEVATGILLQALKADRLALQKAADLVERSWASGGELKATYQEAAELRRQVFKAEMEGVIFTPWSAIHHAHGCAAELQRTPEDWTMELVDQLPLSNRKESFFFVQKEPLY